MCPMPCSAADRKGAISTSSSARCRSPRRSAISALAPMQLTLEALRAQRLAPGAAPSSACVSASSRRSRSTPSPQATRARAISSARGCDARCARSMAS